MRFICEPYYFKEDSSGIIKFNSKYGCKVVRIPSFYEGLKFKMDIFSSKAGEWRQSVVSCPRRIRFHQMSYRFVAHNGILYWSANSGFLIGFDLLSNETERHRRFIEFDEPFENLGTVICCQLGVSQGRLRMCRFFSKNLSIWILGVGGTRTKMVLDT